ncbi:MAG: hypothetical protein ACXACY_17020 [Candidatus Hodarchaeales archaeon]|jgi:hypothetical protein
MTQGKGGISDYRLIIYLKMQNYRRKNTGKFLKGKEVYDIQKALKEDDFISKFYKGKPKELSHMLYDVKKSLERGTYFRVFYDDPPLSTNPILRIKALTSMVYKVNDLLSKSELRIVLPEDYASDYERKKDVFGSIDRDNCIWKEIKDLIAKEEDFEKHSRRLYREYNLNKRIIKNLWSWIEKHMFEGMTQDEIEKDRELHKMGIVTHYIIKK